MRRRFGVLLLAVALLVLPETGRATPARAPRPPEPVDQAAPFAPTLLPSTSGSPVDCVILAPDSLADVYQRLADHHTRTGRRTVVRSLGTVRSLDPRSNDLAQAVRSFIKSAYELWGTRWAVLAGDHEALPLRIIRVTSPFPEDIPSDAYYADLDGTWDRNGNGVFGEVADSLDMVPDVAVGRLPATTRAQASAMVDKILAYELNARTAAGRHLSLAEVLFPTDWQPGQFVNLDGAVYAESLLARLPGCVVPRRLYQNHTGPFPPTPEPLNEATATAALHAAYGTVAHFGHGSRSQISLGSDLMTSSEAAAAVNQDSTSIWLSNNCASAAVDFDSFAERLLRIPVGGAIAYIGATRDAWPENDAAISNDIFEGLFGGSPVALGDAVEQARAGMLPAARSQSLARWGYLETILLGNPALRVWRCPPSTLQVTAPATVALNAGAFTVSVSSNSAPVESALVTAWKNGEEYRVAWTNAAGVANLPFHPASTGAFSLVVTAQDALPFADSLDVTSGSGAKYAVLNLSARDDLGGDADGSVGAGETFGLGGTIRNAGVAGGGALQVSIAPLSSGVVVVTGTAAAPALGAGATTPIPVGLRARALAPPHVARTERVRLVVSDGARADTTELDIAVGAPELLLAGRTVTDTPGGDGDGVLEAGETAFLAFTVANEGGGRARAVRATLSNPAPGVTILTPTTLRVDVAPGGVGIASGARIQVTGAPSGRLFDLAVQDSFGYAQSGPADLDLPGAPSGLRVERSGVDRIEIAWDAVSSPGLAGYRVYRGPNDLSTPIALSAIPLRRIPLYEDGGLAALTAYRYQVSAIDSSGNESVRSAILLASTTPQALTGWPLTVGASTSSSVVLSDLDGDDRPEVIVGAEYLYVARPDGTDWIDGDQSAITTGIFSTSLRDLPSSPAAADLDGDGTPEIIAASWSDSSVAVFSASGAMWPGWPRKGGAPFWSCPAVGDIDGDGELEIVIGSNGTRLYAWNADGSEVLNGDANPATDGVYFVPLGTVFSSPAIADLDRDGTREIVFGTSAGRVYALHGGAAATGWPFVGSGAISASPAVGDVVPGGGLEVAIASTADSVYLLTSSGARAPGWPRPLELTTGNGRAPSPVLAPLRRHLGDPTLCVIVCGANGRLVAYDPSGATLPGWSLVQLGAGAATEASPAVGDLDGDGSLEVLIGAEDRRLYAFHYDGTPVAGFPIETAAELRGTPAIWDIDGDGATDIVIAGWDRNVYAWRYPGVFDGLGMAWPMFHHDNWRTGLATFPILTSVDGEPPEETPDPSPAARAALLPNRPNPFNPHTVLGFTVPGSAPALVRITVHSVDGRLVRTLVSRRVEPGYHEALWDGRNESGVPVASGVYIGRAVIGGAAFARKMTLLR